MALRHESEWQSKRSLADCMRYMLDNKIATDVCFEVGPPNGKTNYIYAHKYVLIARSPVFESMFSSGMTECSGPQAKVRVEDIDIDIFKELLNYMYYERAPLFPESAVHLIYAAEKYMLSKLVAECGRCLLENLDVSNVIEFLDHSLHLDEKRLKRACLKLISLNANDVLTGIEVLSASRLVIEAILDAKTFPVGESIIYEAAVNWAKHQFQRDKSGEYPTDLQIRETLGHLLYKIRFPVMKPIEFAEISAENNVLTAEEKESIYYFLATGKIGCEFKFPTVGRIGEKTWIDESSFWQSDQWHSVPDTEATNFMSDQRVPVTDFELFSGQNGRYSDAPLENFQPSNSVAQNRYTRPFSGDSNLIKNLLDRQEGILYSVWLCMMLLWVLVLSLL